MSTPFEVSGFTIIGEVTAEFQTIFTTDAMTFVGELVENFQPILKELLQARINRQQQFDAGALPDFLTETKSIRERKWTIKSIPDELQDRRVEITGPVDRKMIINALNARVKVFMADFEDSLSPTWENVAQGQINMRDAVNGTITFDNPETGKHYKLDADPAVLMCRVRGLHLEEKHISYKGQIIPGCLLDFGLYFYHNYITLLAKGSGVYFYLPKLQSHIEARWWDEVFTYAEEKYALEVGTIKATVLIETLPAVFEMDEILFEMRNHIVGLNCGRWDYIFSYIKTLRKHADRVLPDRQVLTMDQGFLSAYSRLLIKTCHKRGAFAMGGMAAFVPAKTAEQNAKVLAKVTKDKTLEANNGHDGTWVAHPGLADTAMSVFNDVIGEGNKNQLQILREEDAEITATQLLEPCEGDRTEEGMRLNIRIALQYIESWISGNGCVPIYGLMEDAATAEISRTSIWQWIQNKKDLSNGKLVTKELFREFLQEETKNVKQEIGTELFAAGKFDRAAKLLDEITTCDELVDFLTLPGYAELN